MTEKLLFQDNQQDMSTLYMQADVQRPPRKHAVKCLLWPVATLL